MVGVWNIGRVNFPNKKGGGYDNYIRNAPEGLKLYGQDKASLFMTRLAVFSVATSEYVGINYNNFELQYFTVRCRL